MYLDESCINTLLTLLLTFWDPVYQFIGKLQSILERERPGTKEIVSLFYASRSGLRRDIYALPDCPAQILEWFFYSIVIIVTFRVHVYEVPVSRK